MTTRTSPYRRYVLAGASVAIVAGAVTAALLLRPTPAGPNSPGEGLIARAQRDPAPDFVVRTTDGESFSLRGARGRVVVVGFVTPYCLDCIEDLQAMRAVHEAHAGSVEVIALDQGGFSDAQIVDYYRDKLGGGSHRFARDDRYDLAVAFEVRATGTTVVVDRRGRVAYRDEGATSASRLVAAISRLSSET